MYSSNSAHQESQGFSAATGNQGIAVSGLSFSYDGRAIFSSFSMVSAARRVVLKGPSGCGKTTLLRLLFGSLQANPGARLPRMSKSMLILQEDALFPWLTGRSNLSKFINIPASDLESHQLFPVVAEFIDRPVHQMSYGQRRAVELFRVVLCKPEIVYIDEPFNYLDDSRASSIITSLLEISSSSQLVITTHRHDHSLDSVSDVMVFSGEPPYSGLERIQ